MISSYFGRVERRRCVSECQECTGLKIYGHFRRDERPGGIALFLCSAVLEIGPDDPVDFCVVKPVDPHAFLRHITAVDRSPSGTVGASARNCDSLATYNLRFAIICHEKPSAETCGTPYKGCLWNFITCMTKERLEAEIARLRALLTEAGVEPDQTNDRSEERSGPACLGGTICPPAHKDAFEGTEARHRAIFESAVDFAIIVTDPNGIVTDWNSGAELVLGWTADEMKGRDAERIFTPEDRDNGRIQVEMNRSVQDGRASDERWHLRKNGQRFWASGEMMPLLSESREHIGFVKILRDRTEEHLAGAELRRAQQRFEAIFETIEAAFAIVEVKFDAEDKPIDYRFVEANPAFERQAGVNLVGKWVTEYAPDLEQFWFETYGNVAKTGEPTIFENYAESFQRWFDVRAVRVGNPADRQIAISQRCDRAPKGRREAPCQRSPSS
jgi:PAS domain S-box-containing protein